MITGNVQYDENIKTFVLINKYTNRNIGDMKSQSTEMTDSQ